MRHRGIVKHLIMGTAGHIDHGKTALVKALTGIDCDTHQEEKRRGITINLGFAHLALPGGDIVGIIDVPGHRDFVHTMVAGAQGIDFVLMVIAADSGVMPQAREHLQICQVLGVKRGIVAVNKVDLADAASLAGVHAAIREWTKGTFLDGCAMVDVSAVAGTGIVELTAALAAEASAARQRPSSGVFRMYIDRIFSVSGFGTVVTGSVIGGSLRAGQLAWLLPSGREVRVRRMQRHGADTEMVVAGDRASLNLAGLSKEEFRRGMLVADRPLAATRLLDATVRLFASARPLSVWSEALFIMGTFEAQARIHLLETNDLAAGRSGLAQIHLPEPCVAQAQDAFVLRSTSGDSTIGGGEIIDPHPLHHRRRPARLVRQLQELAGGRLPQLVAMEVGKHPAGIERAALATALNVSHQEIDSVDVSQLSEQTIVLASGEKRFFITQTRFSALVSKAEKNLSDFHAATPFSDAGRSAEEMQGILGFGQGDDARLLAGLFLNRLVDQGVLKLAGHTFALARHRVNLSKQDRDRCRIIEDYVRNCGMQAPVAADLAAHVKTRGIDGDRLQHLLRFLASAKVLVAVEGTFLHASIVDKCRSLLLAGLASRPDGLTVAQFRDLVQGNRKICLLLYTLFDSEGITVRRGDVRVLTEKGMERVCAPAEGGARRL